MAHHVEHIHWLQPQVRRCWCFFVKQLH